MKFQKCIFHMSWMGWWAWLSLANASYRIIEVDPPPTRAERLWAEKKVQKLESLFPQEWLNAYTIDIELRSRDFNPYYKAGTTHIAARIDWLDGRTSSLLQNSPILMHELAHAYLDVSLANLLPVYREFLSAERLKENHKHEIDQLFLNQPDKAKQEFEKWKNEVAEFREKYALILEIKESYHELFADFISVSVHGDTKSISDALQALSKSNDPSPYRRFIPIVTTVPGDRDQYTRLYETRMWLGESWNVGKQTQIVLKKQITSLVQSIAQQIQKQWISKRTFSAEQANQALTQSLRTSGYCRDALKPE